MPCSPCKFVLERDPLFSMNMSTIPSSRSRLLSNDSVDSSSGSTLAGYNTENRPRSNTGDSSMSISENKSLTITGPDGKPLQGARRRSHRPRGCRGGRKNRKNKERSEISTPIDKSSCTVLSTMENLQTTCIEPPSSAVTLFKETLRLSKFGSEIGGAHPPARSVPQPYIDQNRSLRLELANEVGIVKLQSILPPPPTICQNDSTDSVTGPNPSALSAIKRAAVSRSEEFLPLLAARNNFAEEIESSVSDQYTQCFEKQRIPFADGGSLFMTSPRSFLLGEKRPFHWNSR